MPIASKLRRFVATFRGRRLFANAESAAQAVPIIRNRLIRECREENLPIDPALASDESFRLAASVRESHRY